MQRLINNAMVPGPTSEQMEAGVPGAELRDGE